MLTAKLGLTTAAAARGGRATEQNIAAFDLKTCGTRSPQSPHKQPYTQQCHSSALCLHALLSVIRSRDQKSPLLDVAFLTVTFISVL